MTDDIRNQLLNTEKIGKVAYESLRKERFCEKTVRLSETIHAPDKPQNICFYSQNTCGFRERQSQIQQTGRCPDDKII